MEKKSFYNVGKVIISSAPFALLLSLILFWVEQYTSSQETAEMLEKMKGIESSLSTRHLGIFPEFIKEINAQVLQPDMDPDSEIVIFEDVLFYGAFSSPDEFVKMTNRIIHLNERGHSVYIAFYDNQDDPRQFLSMMQEAWFMPQDLLSFHEERRKMLEDPNYHPECVANRGERMKLAGDELNEICFNRYRQANMHNFQEAINRMRVNFGDAKPIYKQIDSLRVKYLAKPDHEITFQDIYSLYNETTDVLRTHYQALLIHLLPMHSQLTLSCWANSKFAIFALPGRFAADEIGFETRDENILKYIQKMKAGVESEELQRTERTSAFKAAREKKKQS